MKEVEESLKNNVEEEIIENTEMDMMTVQKKYMNEFLRIEYKSKDEDLTKYVRMVKNRRA